MAEVEARGPAHEENQARVADIMTHKVVVLAEENNLAQVVETFKDSGFHHVPVVDGNKLVGMLSQRDVLKNTVTGVDHSAIAQGREARFLEQTFVRDVMQVEVFTAHPDDLLSVAAERMLSAGVGALAVVDAAGDLLGIVTANDILRLVAKRGFLKSE